MSDGLNDIEIALNEVDDLWVEIEIVEDDLLLTNDVWF